MKKKRKEKKRKEKKRKEKKSAQLPIWEILFAANEGYISYRYSYIYHEKKIEGRNPINIYSGIFIDFSNAIHFEIMIIPWLFIDYIKYID